MSNVQQTYGWQDAELTEANHLLIPAILKLLPKREARILDLGCGNGTLAAALHQQGYEVVALDASADGINLARQQYPGIRFETCSIYEVTEALAYGVPVITTHGTPWRSLVQQGCGWWVEPTADGLAMAIREAVSVENRDLRLKGERGRQYVQSFDWHNIARMTADVYRWVLGLGEKPDCVQLD